MRLYLSSFRLTGHHRRLLDLLGSGRRTALVSNALDAQPDETRSISLRRDLGELRAAGLEVSEVDLRAPGAVGRLSGFDLIWVRGGNVFALRKALAETGADEVLADLLRADAVVYGGYSAGACVLAPDLDGLDLVDDATAVADPVHDGLGLIDRPIVPHVDSPGHPETRRCAQVSARYRAMGRAHYVLRDGEVLLVDGDSTEILPAIPPIPPIPATMPATM